MADTVAAGGTLTLGQSITSANGEFSFVLQNDGNLVLYAEGGAVSSVALWASGTAGQQVWQAVMQNDGNLVLYAPDEQTPLWASGSGPGHPGAWLIVQDDGNLVIYEPGGVTALWATDTDIIASNKVPNFLPSQSGFHFANAFEVGTNFPVITLPVVGTIISQDAAKGLCGGFVFAALDLFLHNPRIAPPATAIVHDPSPLFNYLVRRLLDSLVLNGPKDIQWIQLPTHDVEIEIFEGPGISRRMVDTEWPKIKADIDSGRPSPLSLVGNPGRGFGDVPGIISTLAHCHQVLAFSYMLFASGELIIGVYDCNDPGVNNSQISLNISRPRNTIVIQSPAITQAGNLTIRGIFRSTYTQNDPPPLN